MKYWLVIVTGPQMGMKDYYLAESNEECPLDKLEDWYYEEALVELWNSYCYMYDSDADEMIENGEDESSAWDIIFEEFEYESNLELEEISKEDFEQNQEIGYEVVYSEVSDKEGN